MRVVILLSFMTSFSFLYYLPHGKNAKFKMVLKTIAILGCSCCLLYLYTNMNLYFIPFIYSIHRNDNKYWAYSTFIIALLSRVILNRVFEADILYFTIQLSLIFILYITIDSFLDLNFPLKIIFYSLIISFDNEFKFMYTDFIANLISLVALFYIGDKINKRLNFPKDSLTSLRRYGYLSHIDKKLHWNNTPFSVLFIDIDDFKQINDTLGHEIGNHILKELAGLLNQSIRPTDFLIRYGGEEFVIILNDIERSTALNIAERLRKKISGHPFSIDDKTVINITISIGVSSSDENCGELFELITIADKNLYKAKKLGKNRIYPL